MTSRNLESAQAALTEALARFRDYPLTDDVYGIQSQVTDAMESAREALAECRRSSSAAALVEIGKYLSPQNMNVLSGDLIASIRDLAQIALSGMENTSALERKLEHEVGRLTEENNQLRDAAFRQRLALGE